ncbi:hypothetical protein QBC37DRAFT_434290 [Rhypophila decipiens]|uniref:Uncharacterized protein n=1 Tax=Rhypophila decipiens TaxID=261697 RepID=A0AAN7AZ77_9PEZI|nr:hypothetical protein QBC37DRAFT_434290 [Rhypophila decipiens]
MQHLEKTHGSVPMPVQLVVRRDVYRDRPDGDGHDDCTFQKFHEFPMRWGWSILDDYRLQTITPRRLDFWPFLQSWLFFGLLYTVVQENQQPIITFEALRGGTSSLPHVTTEGLDGALEKWHLHVVDLSQRDPNAARILMVRVEEVLKLAKKVVHRNLAVTDRDPKPFYMTCGFSGPRKTAEGPLSLSFMILGETLAARKAAIVRENKLQISGWLDDMTNDGWGPSGHVLQEMKKAEWCPHTIKILRSRLQSHTTLMLAAFLSHKDTTQGREHALHNRDAQENPCTEHKCKFKSEMLGRYATKHTLDCEGEKCKTRGMKGPDMGQILDILSKSEIPSISLTMVNENDFEFSVRSHPRRPKDSENTVDDEIPKYATISHVWSDGWGNEDSNRLYHCQLVFLHQLLQSGLRLSGAATNQIPFWMDTLVIPVIQDPTVIKVLKARNISIERFKILKKEAISQIHDVFFDSEFTVVVDNGLYEIASDKFPCQTAMMILASGWMKRLWTLQEAFLSRRIYVALGGGVGENSPVKDFDYLIDYELRSDSHAANPLPLLTKRYLTESLIHRHRYRAVDQQRRSKSTARAHLSEEVTTPGQLEVAIQGYTLITDAWRAARWRTTSNPAHETLALATLLNMDYSQTAIGVAGLTQPTYKSMDKKETEESDKRVMEFWDLFQKERPGSIPAGLIFLPGDRLTIEGYGWAPRSLLDVFQAHMEHSDPFPAAERRAFFPTKIHPEWGLHVRYPGFLLHCKNEQRVREIMRSNISDEKPPLIFPANGSYLEWYSVRPADSVPTNNSAFQTIMARRTQLAIILTRPVSQNMISEDIGLLVEIYKTNETRKPDRTSQWSYCCQIVRHVLVKRDLSRWQLRDLSVSSAPAGAKPSNETAEDSSDSIYGPNAPPQLQLMPDTLRPGKMTPESEDDICVAETLETSQEWYVDSFQASRDKDLPTFWAPEPVVAPTQTFIGAALSRFGMTPRNPSRKTQVSSPNLESASLPRSGRLPRANTFLPSTTTSPGPLPEVRRADTFGSLSSLRSFFSG